MGTNAVTKRQSQEHAHIYGFLFSFLFPSIVYKRGNTGLNAAPPTSAPPNRIHTPPSDDALAA